MESHVNWLQGAYAHPMRPPPYWPAWLEAHPERRCIALSKRRRVRCRCVAMPGKRVCRFHGGASRGPFEVNWQCRPKGVEAKARRAREQGLSRHSDQPPDRGVDQATDAVGARELTVADVEALMAAQEERLGRTREAAE